MSAFIQTALVTDLEAGEIESINDLPYEANKPLMRIREWGLTIFPVFSVLRLQLGGSVVRQL